jgi:hypothetical protein
MGRRYEIGALEPEDAVLVVDRVEYPIPDALTIPMMAKFMRLAKQIELRGDDAEAAVEAMNEAHDAILEYVRLRTPGANFQLDTNGIVGAIGFIVGNLEGPEREVIDAMREAGGGEAEPSSAGEPRVAIDDDGPPTQPETRS